MSSWDANGGAPDWGGFGSSNALGGIMGGGETLNAPRSLDGHAVAPEHHAGELASSFDDLQILSTSSSDGEQGGLDGHDSDLANGDFDKDDDSSASDSEYAEYAESDSSDASSLESSSSGMGVFVLRVPDQPERGRQVHAHEQVVLQRAERQLEFVHRRALGEGQQEGGGAA